MTEQRQGREAKHRWSPWSKHATDFRRQPLNVELIVERGLDWYARHVILREIIAGNVEPDRAAARYPMSFWLQELSTKEGKLIEFLDFLRDWGKIFYEREGKFLTIEYPEMFELRDEYSRKINRKAKKQSLGNDADLSGQDTGEESGQRAARERAATPKSVAARSRSQQEHGRGTRAARATLRPAPSAGGGLGAAPRSEAERFKALLTYVRERFDVGNRPDQFLSEKDFEILKRHRVEIFKKDDGRYEFIQHHDRPFCMGCNLSPTGEYHDKPYCDECLDMRRRLAQSIQ